MDMGFITIDINKESYLLYGEVTEAYDAWHKKDDMEEKLADAAILSLGLAEILGVDLTTEIEKKIKTVHINSLTAF